MWKLLSSFYRTEVFLFHWKKENNRDFFRENLKEEFVVYQKVDTNLNFVDREKQVEKLERMIYYRKYFEKTAFFIGAHHLRCRLRRL